MGGALGALAAGGLWPTFGAAFSFTAMAMVGVIALLLVVFVLARSPLLMER